MPYKLIIFDWDGTLFDTLGLIKEVIHQSAELAELSQPTERDIRNAVAVGFPYSFIELFPDISKRTYELFKQTFYLKLGQLRSEVVSLFPETKNVLTKLKSEGYLLAVATGKSRPYLDHELEHTGVVDLFEKTLCVDDGFTKPDPKMLIDIMETLQISARDTLMIGDSDYDLVMANEAGVDALAVAYSHHDVEPLKTLHPKDILENITDLPEWLSRH